MMIIGLTGGSGSGKGAVCRILEEFNIPTIDTDAVYREMTASDSPCTRALSEEFGEKIISETGGINRAVLRTLVFSGDGYEKRLARLNEITHTFILDETRQRLRDFERSGKPLAVVDAPVLFESGFDKECDVIVSIVADREKRIMRIVERDKISAEKAIERINSQKSDEELVALSDFTVYNNGNLSELREQVKLLLQKLNCKL